ncbi:MAG: endonuclease/exonuclease/phosphatase family protein, partial [Cyclobacteriaceae bacterium]
MILFAEILKFTLSGISLIAMVASLLKVGVWWVRVFDFPRIQILCMGMVALFFFFIPSFNLEGWNITLFTLVVISLVYQARKIFPYSIIAGKEVLQFKGEDDEKDNISLLVSNVYTPNRSSEKLVHLVKQYDPDLLLTLESDQWWENQLNVLEEIYPYLVKVPLENEYGMHLYSKLPLSNTKILYIIKDDIPSIHSEVTL